MLVYHAQGTTYSEFSTEMGKNNALKDFKKIIDNASAKVGATAMIGFSDDDIKYVDTIENLMNSTTDEDYTTIYKMVVKKH